MRTFLPVGHALQLVLEGVRPRDDEWLERDDWLNAAGMEGLLGRRLSRDEVAEFDVPAFASSAMDGYAVRHDDLGPEGGSLRVVSHAAAGAPAGGRLHAGEAIRIMTGAPVPEGATAVVPVEWTRPGGSDGPERSGAGAGADGVWASVDGGEVVIDRAIEAGKHVRPAAEDVRRGDTVLNAGAVITPPVVGVLAGLGVDRVAVQYRPRVRVISTGDEIVDPSLTPLFGQVRNTNGPGLAAQVLLAGGRPQGVDRGWYHVRDDVDALSQAISDGVREADVMVLSGGVSMGAHDHVQDAMRRAGVEPVFWKVRQRPGKPLLYGRAGAPPSGSGSGSGAGAHASDACHVFGLPGNPVSAAMCFEMYVRPLLDGLAGRSAANWSTGAGLIDARLDEDIRKPEGLHWFVRGVAHADVDGWHVRTTGAQGSNLYGSVLQANCVVHLPEAVVNPAAGSPVAIQWLPWASAPGEPPPHRPIS